MGRKSTYNAKDAAEIYGLFDPRDGALRYVGKANNSSDRLKRHMRDARRRRTPVYDWIEKLGAFGMVPMLRVLERATDWREAECRLIAEARARGERLLNLADGGDQPACSDATRKANGRALSDRLKTDERFRKLWEAKRALSYGLRTNQVMNRTRATMRELAVVEPDMFGCWRHLPDREENADGSPVQAHG